MTVEEENTADCNSVVEKETATTKDEEDKYKEDCVKTKMEAMQRRINELKEKVKYEAELLQKEEAALKPDGTLEKHTKDSSEFQVNLDKSGRDNLSEKSLYFSASSFSLCTVSSSSSAGSAYHSFSRFVNNFVKNQNQRERLSLLQLHSNKQISLNMMKHSLTELDARCSEELELVERSLQHLNKLSEEFGVDKDGIKDTRSRSLELYSKGDATYWNGMGKVSTNFIWPPLKELSSSTHIGCGGSPVFVKCEEDTAE